MKNNKGNNIGNNTENDFEVFAGTTGSGMSFWSKLQLLREIYSDTKIIVLDPKRDFQRTSNLSKKGK